MNDRGWANDVNVIQKGKENIRGKNPTKYCNAQKWANAKNAQQTKHLGMCHLENG